MPTTLPLRVTSTRGSFEDLRPVLGVLLVLVAGFAFAVLTHGAPSSSAGMSQVPISTASCILVQAAVPCELLGP